MGLRRMCQQEKDLLFCQGNNIVVIFHGHKILKLLTLHFRKSKSISTSIAIGGLMRLWKSLLLLFFITLLFSCAAVPDKQTAQPLKLFAAEGTILTCSQSELLLSVQIPSFPKTADNTVSNIAHQVVQKSYLLEGTKIVIDGREGTIAEVRGNQVKLIFDSAFACSAGRKVAVQVPKKTIAVVDFEVIGGNQKEKGRVALEGLTSALIDTGQFIVVERTKLQSVMNEIQLSLSGMTKPTGDKVAGKLLIADLILTGSLTDMRDEWRGLNNGLFQRYGCFSQFFRVSRFDSGR